jgi:hypothetical protein
MKRIIAALMALVLILMMAGCVVKTDTYLYKSNDGDWSIKMPSEFV